MASADYCLCDVCGGKAFYDANLNYQFPQKDGTYEYGLTPIRDSHMALDYLGDWAVLCVTCAKTHKAVVMLLPTPPKGEA